MVYQPLTMQPVGHGNSWAWALLGGTKPHTMAKALRRAQTTTRPNQKRTCHGLELSCLARNPLLAVDCISLDQGLKYR